MLIDGPDARSVDVRDGETNPAGQRAPILNRTVKLKDLALLLAISVGAIAVHGYHPFIEDGEIYVPGIKQVLNPALYPHNAEFFSSHAHMTLFPWVIAMPIRFLHIPFEYGLLLWHLGCIFMLLLACWHIGRLAFRDPLAKWGGVTLIAALLTLPVAGTALYIMDQYVTTRAVSTPAVLFIALNSIERKYVRAAGWAFFTILIHPLMAVFGISYGFFCWMQNDAKELKAYVLAESTAMFSLWFLLPLRMFPPVTGAYRAALETRSYFFLAQWAWYEWLGLLAPMVVIWGIQRIARKQGLSLLERMCGALLWFGGVFFAASLIISIPPGMARFAELQPMRYLHLLYVLMFVFIGGLLAEFILKKHVWRWTVLFVPLCGAMFYVQRESLAATPHIEWPNAASSNDWVQAFVWIRKNTPVSAYFALNPDHMNLPGEDHHGFRAVADRSMLADRLKDSGAVTMFPAIAETWEEQTLAQQQPKRSPADFQKLKNDFGVDWVVVESPGINGLNCPYQNRAVLVCRLD